MKNIFIAVAVFLLLGSCDREPIHDDEKCIVKALPPADSILNLADQVVEYVIGREVRKEQHIDSLRKALKVSGDVSTEQILQMEREMRNTRREQHLYSQELDDYKTKRIVRKDSIVYKIKKVKRVDTIVVNVYDTVIVVVSKKLCKQHIKNQKKKKND